MQALAAVNRKLEVVADPTQVKYHMPKTPGHPQGLKVQVRSSRLTFI